MSSWTDKSTDSHQGVDGALGVVDNILSFVKSGAGKPSEEERALFAAAVVFTYGIWEHFVEQLAIELAEKLGGNIAPERVPDPIRKILEKKSAWDLTVTPGWRALWIEHVRLQAVGDGGEHYGMNTAKSGQVKQLLSLAGVADPYAEVPADAVPDHLAPDKNTVVDAINILVELRGEIVHTGKVPDSLRKKHVLAWRSFIEAAATGIDKACRASCKVLLRV